MDYNLKLLFLFNFSISINGHGQYSDPYLRECGLQPKNNTYVNICDRMQELSVVRSVYDNVNFLCVVLDNRNGQYSNQIIKLKISNRNNYRIALKSASEIQKNQYKINAANIIIFAIYSKKLAENELPNNYSIKMGENECDQNNITNSTNKILRRIPRAIKECTVPARDLVLTVSNGERVPDRYYPWHVSIFRTKESSSTFICGGSIISHEYILTAAHCLYEEKRLIINSRLFIRVGSNNREKGDYYGINKKRVHSDFNFITFKSDIALLQTLNEIEYSRSVNSVCFTAIDFKYANMDAWIPGWGLTENQTAGLTEELNHVSMLPRTNADCEESNPKFFREYVNNNNFCAGYLNTTSICRGDSGGGLVMKKNDGWYIRGIASFTPSSRSGLLDVCDLTQFAVFTDVVQFAEWINENMEDNVTTRKPPRTTTTTAPNTTLQITEKECTVPARGTILRVSYVERVPKRYYPWHVAIFKSEGKNPSMYICAGSIISREYILSAAHCLHEDNLPIINSRLFIRTGSNFRESGDHYRINSKVIHSDYDFSNYKSDIALLQTRNEIDYSRNVRPVCYDAIDFKYTNIDAWMPGWGLTENQTTESSNYLNHAIMPGRTHDDCRERNPSFFKTYVNNKNFCAGNLNGTSICRSESGNGLVIPRNDGWYIRGIASITPSTRTGASDVCDLTQFVLFTDVVQFASWIDIYVNYEF